MGHIGSHWVGRLREDGWINISAADAKTAAEMLTHFAVKRRMSKPSNRPRPSNYEFDYAPKSFVKCFCMLQQCYINRRWGNIRACLDADRSPTDAHERLLAEEDAQRVQAEDQHVQSNVKLVPAPGHPATGQRSRLPHRRAPGYPVTLPGNPNTELG
eukprot:267975-Prorocentrum_minimum.AAC.1